MKTKQRGETAIVVLIVLGVLIAIGSPFFLIPLWNVWSSGLSGEAELKQADWNRQIAVREANAKKEAATLLAEADVVLAKDYYSARLSGTEGMRPPLLRSCVGRSA